MKPVETQGALPAAGQVERTERVWRVGAESDAAGREAAQEARRQRSARSVERLARTGGDPLHPLGRDGGGQSRRHRGGRERGDREDPARDEEPADGVGPDAREREHHLDIRIP